MTFPESVFPDIDAETRDQRLQDAGLRTVDTVFNAYLLKHPDGAYDLIDTGCGIGSKFGTAAGLLPSRLKALGVAPSAIRRVILTHLHGDHAGGVLVDGAAAFPKAELLLHEDELAANAQSDDVAAMQTAYHGRIRTVTEGEDLGGLSVWHLPGHTPGHIGFWIGEGFAIVTDILHSAALQLPDPGLCPIFDHDPAQARLTRHASLTRLAESGAVWSGSHLMGKAFVRVEALGDGFRTIPA